MVLTAEESQVCTVYALREAGTLDIRYVGQTIGPIAQRLAAHIKRARQGVRGPRHAWIRKVLRNGGRIEVVALQDGAKWNVDEPLWIAKMRQKCPNLTNIAAGGGSHSGYTLTDEVKSDISAKCRAKWSDNDYRDRASAGMKASWTPGRRAAQSERASMQKGSERQKDVASKMMLKRYSDPENRAAQSAHLDSIRSDPKRLERLAEALRRPEYRALRSAQMKALWAKRKETSNSPSS